MFLETMQQVFPVFATLVQEYKYEVMTDFSANVYLTDGIFNVRLECVRSAYGPIGSHTEQPLTLQYK